MKRIQSEGDLDELVRNAKSLATIGAWAKNGYFESLAKAGEPVALETLGGDLRALTICARVLAHLGILSGYGELWSLSTTGRRLYEEGALARAGLLGSLQDLSRLDELLETGEPIRKTDVGVNQDDPDGVRVFMDMLYRRSATSAYETARWIDERLGRKGHVLDLGGGHGRYAMALVERGMDATLFDLPMIVDLASERFGDTLRYRKGNFFEDDLGGPYDAALLSNIVHGLGPAENVALLSSLRKSLATGGLLVIKDMFLEDTGIHPDPAVYFALTMLNYTRSGNSYTFAETRQWCEQTHFEPLPPVNCDGFQLFFARAV
jgi:hypothetical protein